MTASPQQARSPDHFRRSDHPQRSPDRRCHTRRQAKTPYTINRYYDPTTAQFLNVDPIVDQTGEPYLYAGDDPINQTDPLGLCWYCIADPWSHANPLYKAAEHGSDVSKFIGTYDPAYHAINDAYNAYQAAQLPCSSNWSIAKNAAEAFGWSALTVVSATGVGVGVVRVASATKPLLFPAALAVGRWLSGVNLSGPSEPDENITDLTPPPASSTGPTPTGPGYTGPGYTGPGNTGPGYTGPGRPRRYFDY